MTVDIPDRCRGTMYRKGKEENLTQSGWGHIQSRRSYHEAYMLIIARWYWCEKKYWGSSQTLQFIFEYQPLKW